MMIKALSFLLIFVLGTSFHSNACSMYKVTVDGKTIIGNNEDNWRITPHIWFEVGTNGNYGCCFVGSRSIGQNKYAPQSGMNEQGLTFSRLASYHPLQENTRKSLKLIEQPDHFLIEVLKSCKNIDEVYAMLDQYDRTCYLEDVFVYVEPSGEYLVVEPYKLIRGTDPSYVQANFCPSITSEEDRRFQARYRDGRDLLDKEMHANWEFCTKVSKEMHVCRDKIGDGTLLTTLWNTDDLQLKLYFYHNYDTAVTYDLMGELAKGDHQLEIEALFPENQEFEQLKSYVTPFNTPWLRFLLVFIGMLFAGSSLYFLIAALRTGRKRQTRTIQLLISAMLALGLIFAFVLATTINIYYFPAPYFDPMSTFKTVAAFSPYAITTLLILIGILLWRKRSNASWSTFSKGLLLMNFVVIAGMYVGFFYWGLL